MCLMMLSVSTKSQSVEIYRGRVFWDIRSSQSGSWIWRKLLKLRNLARSFLCCSVVSGSRALFWHDDWTDLGPLILLTGANGPRVTGILYSATVADAVCDGVWMLPRGRHPISVLLRDILPTSPEIVHNLDDIYTSPTSVPNIFSASKTWTALNPVGHVVSWVSSVWFSQAIPKHAFILWVFCRDRLPTRDRLRSWGLPVSDTCLLWDDASESRSHLFFGCNYASQIWSSLLTHRCLSPPLALDDIVSWVRSASSNHRINVICKLVLHASIYEIWKERNARLHSVVSKPAAQVVKDIHAILRRNLAGLDRQAASLRPSSASSKDSFLST
ncbi:uncharacterized protein LOC112083046 [Eutrema salsugineum]|uniref:uncharacterized protein LOC112083046 n=1 Tax=Eutrema salsugineum TaxID=72664 RepID=UPI000CECE381|nr:uncharacterized protein LOC112083046 [Eutrema salsugineum]